ncbi:D-alanyl-D-alanine carboxypeptidase family protein [Clostridium tyrobutyricum]|uniref:D-alanyl-D-alanine carboxypeptidase family protein n=1 Tax=Clostridium tyrobutyricum TaxID=1519 RepID=UPI0020125FF6|nr:D-alanyl-D-alanine carboxypeptidase family protein [Clostridium tyrobutyricum]MBR9648990.1 D-alanyl-D-alanine carboxypeptidase [Clostridium tyrobutyricum]
MGGKLKKALVFIMVLFIGINIFSDNVFAAIDKYPYIDARCAVAIDSKSKVVLYEKNAYELVPMASTTKIMTSLVAIKYGNLDKKVEISVRSAGIRGSTVGYKKGEKIKLRELLYGLMLRSGNDAAIAISEGVSGSVEEFVKLMNEYASGIGILNTHFETPHGLDKDEHYSTAYDLALVASKAKENKIFNDIVGSKDVDGEKTGYTGKAGKCLVTSAKFKENDIVMVVLNCPGRWKETKKIYDYVSKNYEFKKIFSKGKIALKLNVGKKQLKLKYGEDVVIPIDKRCKYTSKIIKPQKIVSTVKKGDNVGELYIYKDGKKIYNSPLKAGNAVKLGNKFILPFFH